MYQFALRLCVCPSHCPNFICFLVIDTFKTLTGLLSVVVQLWPRLTGILKLARFECSYTLLVSPLLMYQPVSKVHINYSAEEMHDILKRTALISVRLTYLYAP